MARRRNGARRDRLGAGPRPQGQAPCKKQGAALSARDNARRSDGGKSAPIKFFVKDHLGSVRVSYLASLDSATCAARCTLVGLLDYTPYGKVLRAWQNPQIIGVGRDGKERVQTTQHERDWESGWDFRNARYYDADLGRFLSVDPLAGQFPGWSPYNYVLGNPVGLTDLTGMSPDGGGDKDGRNQQPADPWDGWWSQNVDNDGEWPAIPIEATSTRIDAYADGFLYRVLEIAYPPYGLYRGAVDSYSKLSSYVSVGQRIVQGEGTWRDYGVALGYEGIIGQYEFATGLYEGNPESYRALGRMGCDVAVTAGLSRMGLATPIRTTVKASGTGGNGVKLLTIGSERLYRFGGDEAVTHFSTHGKGMMDVLGKNSYNLKNYIEDANDVIRNGTFVPELNGYVKLVGGVGSAKYVFVGINRSTGYITTFHVKPAKQLSILAPSLGIEY